MYGLPKEIDLSFFIGKTLNVVSFTTNTVSLHFDGSVSIIIESEFQHQKGIDAQYHHLGTRQCVLKISSSSLMQLLGHAVRSAGRADDGTLSLEFDDGQVLHCLETTKAYECYNFSNGQETGVV